MNSYVREVVLSTVMQKQAEERSLARRAVLKKVATEVQSAQAGAVNGNEDGLAYRKKWKRRLFELVGALGGAHIGFGVSGLKPSGAVKGGLLGVGAGLLANHIHNKYLESAGVDPTLKYVTTYKGKLPEAV